MKTPQQVFEGLPSMPPVPADLPPNMQSALRELQKALTEPPSLGGEWPFADPPAVQAARAARRAGPGRPGSVAPHQVVMVARFLRLGYSYAEAGERAKVSKATARHIASGQLSVCQHPAVSAAGVTFPVQRGKRIAPASDKNRAELPQRLVERANREEAASGRSAAPGASGGPDSPAPPVGAKTPDPEAEL